MWEEISPSDNLRSCRQAADERRAALDAAGRAGNTGDGFSSSGFKWKINFFPRGSKVLFMLSFLETLGDLILLSAGRDEKRVTKGGALPTQPVQLLRQRWGHRHPPNIWVWPQYSLFLPFIWSRNQPPRIRSLLRQTGWFLLATSGWNEMISKVHSNPTHSIILWSILHWLSPAWIFLMTKNKTVTDVFYLKTDMLP